MGDFTNGGGRVSVTWVDVGKVIIFVAGLTWWGATTQARQEEQDRRDTLQATQIKELSESVEHLRTEFVAWKMNQSRRDARGKFNDVGTE